MLRQVSLRGYNSCLSTHMTNFINQRWQYEVKSNPYLLILFYNFVRHVGLKIEAHFILVYVKCNRHCRLIYRTFIKHHRTLYLSTLNRKNKITTNAKNELF